MTSIVGFDHVTHTRLIYGIDVVDQTGELAKAYTSSGRILLVTDPGIRSAGHADRVVASLEAAGLKPTIFDAVKENPTTVEVDHCVEAAKSADIDMIIGLGGGSSMDTAKGCNFIFTNGGHMQDYWGVDKATQPMLPLIAIPTTAGTGSECQSFALISDADTHAKMACGDKKAAAKVAILDPSITLTQPFSVTAHTGIDAITHALETTVTKKRNEYSLLFAKEAFKLCATSLPRIFDEPDNIEARSQMLLGAAYAGTAIENSMLGAAHATANPLTANFDLIHGLAVGLMMPTVIRFNAQDPAIKRAYRDLVVFAGLCSSERSDDEAVDQLILHLDSILEKAKYPSSLADANVDEAKIPTLAEQAATQWTGTFNPIEVNAASLEGLYRSAYGSRANCA